MSLNLMANESAMNFFPSLILVTDLIDLNFKPQVSN